MDISEFISVVNDWGHNRIPFLFLIDFELKKPLAAKMDTVDPGTFLFSINGFTNGPGYFAPEIKTDPVDIIRKYPIPSSEYREKYDKVIGHLAFGDTYLTNLTIETGILLNYSLRDLFFISSAKYKLLSGNEFLVFSPEIFVQIKRSRIYSFPMKGTIDATIPDARAKILSDKKELAEHVTIVDLIRNDLSQVASKVSVVRFRYVDELKTSTKNLFRRVLRDVRGNQLEAARRLGINRNTLRKRLGQLDIDPNHP